MGLNQSGGVLTTHNFYPFGGEHYPQSTDETHLFTGQERDAETGLDYFGARHYASNLGRFLQPDPFMGSGDVRNPQTWNRYSYALNNPLRLIDPTGLMACEADEDCTITVRLNVILDKNANDGKGPTEKQTQFLKDQLINKAREEFKNSDIEFEVTFTEGSLEFGDNKVTVTGIVEGALNVVATDSIGSVAEKAGVQNGTGLVLVGLEDAGTRTLAHGIAHPFAFHDQANPELFGSRSLKNFQLDMSIDTRRVFQRLGIKQTLFRKGAKRFAIPETKETIKPRKD